MGYSAEAPVKSREQDGIKKSSRKGREGRKGFLKILILNPISLRSLRPLREAALNFALADTGFAMQSDSMNPNWAEENLQTIRTLMERSALYRRALAPIMLLAGALGIAAAAIGLIFDLVSPRLFGALWLGTAVVAIVGVFLIARRQSLKDREAFWSPPTRRVALALFPPLLAGLFISLCFLIMDPNGTTSVLVVFWVLLYGCALHAAGFFMPRGIKLFGWLFIATACGLIFIVNRLNLEFFMNWLMGFFFGVLHLAYGIYLYLTEKGKNAA